MKHINYTQQTNGSKNRQKHNGQQSSLHKFRHGMASIGCCLILLLWTASGLQAQLNPPWQWAKTTGDTSNIETPGSCIATDPNTGSIFVAGPFNDTKGWNPGSIGNKRVSFGNTLFQYEVSEQKESRNGFLVKYDSSGKVLWGRKIASTVVPYYYPLLGTYWGTGVVPMDMVVDQEGNIYLSGSIIAGQVTFDTITININDAAPCGFIVKYDAGGDVAWAKVQVGSQRKVLNKITLGGDGNQELFVTGIHDANATFTFGGASISTTAKGSLLAKVDASTGQVLWHQHSLPISVGGYAYGNSGGIIADGASCYISGDFAKTFVFGRDTVFYPGPHANARLFGYGCILKFDASSGAREWGRAFGCPRFGQIITSGLVLDRIGNVYIAGTFYDGMSLNQKAYSMLPDTLFFSDSVSIGFHAYTRDFLGYDSIPNFETGFVAKYNAHGNALWARGAERKVQSKYFPKAMTIRSLAMDGRGYLYVAGRIHPLYLSGMHFPPVEAYVTYSTLHLTKFDPDGYVVNLYGLTEDPGALSVIRPTNHSIEPNDMVADHNSNIYLTGRYVISNVAFGKDTLRRNDSVKMGDFFIAKLGVCSGNGTMATVPIRSCDSYTSPSGRYTWNTSGTYYDTISSSSGCDSSLTIQLTIAPTASQTLDVAACYSYTAPSGRQTWKSSGTYSDTLKNIAGCDSMLSIRLSIHEASYYNLRHTACVSYTSPSGKHVWNSNGFYTDTIPNSQGCDSIINIQLTVIPTAPDTAITANKTTLTARASGVGYQWVDCGNNYSPIAGAIGKNFTPTQSGSYAVIITDGCADTSSCYTLNLGTGISAANGWAQRIQLYPNPTRHTVQLQLELPGRKEIKVVNNLGQEVLSRVTTQAQLSINLQQFADGIYFFHIRTDAGTLVKKVILNQHHQ